MSQPVVLWCGSLETRPPLPHIHSIGSCRLADTCTPKALKIDQVGLLITIMIMIGFQNMYIILSELCTKFDKVQDLTRLVTFVLILFTIIIISSRFLSQFLHHLFCTQCCIHLCIVEMHVCVEGGVLNICTSHSTMHNYRWI